VVYDNDSAGISGAKKAVKILGESRCKIYTFTGFGEKYDVCDFFANGGTTEGLKEILKGGAKFLTEI